MADLAPLRSYVERAWEREILPTLTTYIAIPNKSPAFDADWAAHGHMDRATSLLESWAKAKLANTPGATVEVVRLEQRTPVIFIEVPGTVEDTVLLYGHLDKQPEMEGWSEGLGPWTPAYRDGKLYGRGGADDGYALFASLTAILALKAQSAPHARSVVLIEACEESGSYDLPAYVAALRDRIGSPSLVVCLDQVYRTGEPYVATGARYAFQLERDGPVTERFVDFVYQPVRDAAGEITGIFVEGADVTERARADAALRDLNATLEVQVAERTAALRANEEALRQAQKREAIGQLTGGIAHDFNNLLAAMSGSLELLERRLAEGRLVGAERYITTAQEATRRASALTQRLLAFARRQTLDPKPVDLNRMIAGMADLINRTVGPSVEVEVVGAGGLWTTKLDPGQLESALLNLCINARDAMAPGGGKITIETANKWLDDRAARQRDLAPGQYVSLCVTDTGTGMSDDLITKIFDPFFTTKPLGYGTGLGLSMVYGFVRQSGGQVRVYSELGKGTTMCLYLPRHLGGIESEESLGHEDIDPGAGETVLVIDDEAAIRMLIGEVLLDNGYRVLESSDGPSGLKILESDARIDLLITDVGLPGGLNGRQVADAARVKRPDLKVLFITGFAENAILANGVLDHGMSVITKPFVMSGLANKVREIIGQ